MDSRCRRKLKTYQRQFWQGQILCWARKTPERGWQSWCRADTSGSRSSQFSSSGGSGSSWPRTLLWGKVERSTMNPEFCFLYYILRLCCASPSVSSGYVSKKARGQLASTFIAIEIYWVLFFSITIMHQFSIQTWSIFHDTKTSSQSRNISHSDSTGFCSGGKTSCFCFFQRIAVITSRKINNLNVKLCRCWGVCCLQNQESLEGIRLN